ncbi:putative nucleic acid-binding protein [Croceifilum oryzae]|uniref:Nucleic acid-binding protein n=1 Tax=Croceifilum oryzae TaxID=1553429 RepID=A0AAJ1WU23_9BACL|nr:transposase [Croceifilum oryzae]MDQ0417581.1 putative nucleic acid-binding protein [Croceifilum oryzae]
MKKHTWVQGQLLQTNKTFSHLKMKQREWIINTMRENCMAVLEKKRKPLSKGEKETILLEVLDSIKQHGIWIPEHEVSNVFSKKVARYQRKFLGEISDETNTC